MVFTVLRVVECHRVVRGVKGLPPRTQFFPGKHGEASCFGELRTIGFRRKIGEIPRDFVVSEAAGAEAWGRLTR